jgi:hypothetical protein
MYVKRVFWLVFLCGAASCLAAYAAPLTPVSVSKTPAKPKLTAAQKAAAEAAAMALLAPADEYFGPLKQSVVGINNTIRNLGWYYDVNHDIGSQTFLSAGLTERAIRDWQSKYPHDDQIPRSLYLLQRLYTKILTQQSRDHSKAIAEWIFLSFASSPQAKQLKKTLAVEHLADIPTPSPSPSPKYQSIFGPNYPSEFQQTPTPVSSPTPIPSPGPIQLPNATGSPTG